MKRYIIVISLLAVILNIHAKEEPTSQLPAGAVTNPAVEQSISSTVVRNSVHPEGAVTDAIIEHSESSIIVTMNVHPATFPPKSNREVILTPMIVNGDSAISLRRVIVAGRTRYYQHLRHSKTGESILLRAGDKKSLKYSVTIPKARWMEKGQFIVASSLNGCCNRQLAPTAQADMVAFDFRDKTIEPSYIYIKPLTEMEKARAINGEAYIDFPLGSTEILPDYKRNPQELTKITETVREAKGNRDVTINSLTIKGFASPDGPYDVNERIARGRTNALITYVGNRFSFPKSVLHSEWVAEDWVGLAQRLSATDIADKAAILAVVNDKSLQPDQRDEILRTRFPNQYSWMLVNIYPLLRRTEYRVNYVVRKYTDVGEIAEVMRVAPQHLSLEELFLYAKSLDESSPEFKEVMEVAVRMFPGDPIANLNAAMTAVSHGEYEKASSYLEKADPSPVKTYAEALILVRRGEYSEAMPLLQKAASEGISEATALIDLINERGLLQQ